MPRSSSATTRGCAADRSSSAAGSCSPRATRPSAAACARRWAARWRDGCARRRSWSRRGCRPTRRRAGRCSRSSPTPLRWWRASRSTRPSSTCAGSSGSRGRRWTSPSGCGAGSSSASACPSRSAWRARSSWPRWPAAWPSPTACWWCRPRGELAFLHLLPVERLWGVGPGHAAKLRDQGITSVGEVARLAEPALVALVGRAAGRKLHALAHNRDPRPVQVGVRRRSMGTQHALGRRRRSPEELDAVLVGIVDRIARRLRAAQRVCRTVVLRLRFHDFTRATRSHTLPHATQQTEPILATARALLAAAMPTIERQGLTLLGIALDQPRGRRRRPARASPSSAGTRSTRRSTACATASARRPSPGRCCSGAIRASRCRCCQTEARDPPEPGRPSAWPKSATTPSPPKTRARPA